MFTENLEVWDKSWLRSNFSRQGIISALVGTPSPSVVTILTANILEISPTFLMSLLLGILTKAVDLVTVDLERKTPGLRYSLQLETLLSRNLIQMKT